MVKKEKTKKEEYLQEINELNGYSIYDGQLIINKKINSLITELQTNYLPKLDEIDDLKKEIEKLKTQIG